MKHLFCAIPFVAFLSLAVPIQAAEFFVAVDGKDANSGTKDSPFATVQRAQSTARPGDTVYIRGGTYKMREDQIARSEGIFAYVTYLDKSGTKDSPINYFAYPGEKPVFDLSDVKPANKRIDAFYITGSWLDLKSLEVTGVQVTILTHTQSICFDNEGSNNIYELLSMHDGQAIGMYCTGGANNLILNCDAYRNWDYTSENKRGGNVDGFGYHPKLKGETGNVLRGCRSWFNSDDGYDCINSAEPVTFENCWAMYNGYNDKYDNLGDGNGFKAGGYGATPVERLPNPIPRHVVRNCLAVGNKNNGFYGNHHIGGGDWYDNTAFDNGINFNMLNRLPDNRTDIPGFNHIIKNSLGYKGQRGEIANLNEEKSTLTNNYFDMKVTLTDRDFESLDESQLIAPRQANGDLPKITFMVLAKTSPLYGKGLGRIEQSSASKEPHP